MGIWLDALDEAANGELSDALDRVAHDLPPELRRFVETDERSRVYAGPVVSAIRRYAASKSTLERGRIASFECELVDAIVDDVVASVERSLLLVALCRDEPTATVDELVGRFPWATGLKRDLAWKRAWIADMLRSMHAEEIPLPAETIEQLGDEGTPRFGFDEVAFAAAPERVDLTWKTLTRRLGLDREYSCLPDDDGAGIGAEAVDFGGVRLWMEREWELESALHLVGRKLTTELSVLLETMHESKPADGYRPVAWHAVFWNLESDYEGLGMALRLLDPYCGTDGDLATHIAEHYRDVARTSRVAILRRRQKLTDACVAAIQQRIQEALT